MTDDTAHYLFSSLVVTVFISLNISKNFFGYSEHVKKFSNTLKLHIYLIIHWEEFLQMFVIES